MGISDHSLVHVYRKLGVERSGRGHKTITYRNSKTVDDKISELTLLPNSGTIFNCLMTRMIFG